MAAILKKSVFMVDLLIIIIMSSNPLIAQIYPGLYETDGTAHKIHKPNPVTGNIINVVDFGADPLDNENDDRPAIQTALQTAVFGDELFFPAGTYNFNSPQSGDSQTHIILKNGVNWRGVSMSETILKSGYADHTIERFLKMRGVHDIVLSHFTITSSFQGKYSTDTGNNNPQAGGPRYVISIEEENGLPSYNITVDSVLVEKYRTHGVRLSNSHDVLVRNSIFQNATDVGGGGAGYGVSIQGNGNQGNHSKFNLVESCQFLGPYLRHGIIMQYATHNNAIRFNYCTDNRLDAIDLHGEDEYLNEIYENEVHDVRTGAGVGVGNTGSTHDRSGPFNYIHDNLFVNCREGVKVYLGSPDTRIENNTVTGSTVSSGRGIFILNGPRTIVKENKIFDNTGSGFTGILLQYDGGTAGKASGPPIDVKILENEIYNNPYGVRLFSGERIIYENNDVYGNSITDFYAASSVSFYKLLNITINGDGKVQADPPGDSFPQGAIVQLHALPLANWKFDHWQGDISGSENPVSIEMDQSKEITAVFVKDENADQVNLFTSIVGNGSIVLDPPGGVYERGESVKVSALADSAWKFVAWSGDFSGTAIVDSIVLDSDKSIIATFEKAQMFSIVPWIVGKGDIVFNPAGGIYAEGSSVIVTAVAHDGWQFKSWGGSLSGSINPDTLIMDSEKALMVTFEQITAVSLNEIQYEYQLEQNYPNPFNQSTQITYSLAASGHTTIKIYDIKGRLVNTLVEGVMNQGEYQIHWSADHLPSGVYILQINSGNFLANRKMLLTR